MCFLSYSGYIGIFSIILVLYCPSIRGGCKTIIKKNITLDGRYNTDKTPIVSTTAMFQIGCASECKTKCKSLYYNGRSKKCLIYDSPLDNDLDKYVDEDAAENWSKIIKCSEEPDVGGGCEGSWCLLYPVLISIVVLIIVVLVVVVACCLKKRYESNSKPL